MPDGAWQTTVGTIASTAGLTGFAFTGVQGALAGYHAFISPNASLTKSERKLKMVKSRLQELSPQRREEIEIAARSGSSEFTSLEHLEKQLAGLLDMHCRLSKRCEDTTFTQRHYPGSDFRRRLARFEEHARALLNDTLATTVPCLNDIDFDPENSTQATERPSSSRSTFVPENSLQVTERPPSSGPTFVPENSTQATEGPPSSESTFNPENSTWAMERSSSSKSTFNPGYPRWAMKGSPSSVSTESFNTALESFSDLGDIPLARMV